MSSLAVSTPAYSRDTLRTVLSVHRIPLAWFEAPAFTSGILETEYIKATSNAALIAVEIEARPDDDSQLSALYAAHAAEKHIASVFMELLKLRMGPVL